MDNVDFLPERVRYQRAARRRRVRQAYLLIVCAGMLAGLWFFRDHRVRQAAAEANLLQNAARNVAGQAARRQELEQQLADLSIKKRVEETLGSRSSAQLLLAELQRRLPPTVSLTKIELETTETRVSVSAASAQTSARASSAGPMVAAKDLTAKRVQLKISGLAPTDVDVANCIGQLSASPLFEEVAMGYTRNIVLQGRVAREFRAVCLIAR